MCVCLVLFLPLDVSSMLSQSQMKLCWQIVFSIDAAIIFLIIPYSVIIYEADEDKSACKRALWSMLFEAIFLVICAIVIGVSCYFLGKYTQNNIQYRVDIPTYIIGFVSFLGWYSNHKVLILSVFRYWNGSVTFGFDIRVY
jgi:LMBR1-like membrane protein